MEIVGSLFLCAKDVPSLPEAQVLELISLFLFMGWLRHIQNVLVLWCELVNLNVKHTEK